ncbi:MAG TPA: hypothetical protein VL282_16820 [Tepidisphaeraceae bacterium]|jgi:hypothetical protein|nr:hypothetical protein [Tepidisphaeraceae bacterium]
MYNRRRIRPDGGYYRDTRRQRQRTLSQAAGSLSVIYYVVIACVLIVGIIWILRK